MTRALIRLPILLILGVGIVASFLLITAPSIGPALIQVSRPVYMNTGHKSETRIEGVAELNALNISSSLLDDIGPPAPYEGIVHANETLTTKQLYAWSLISSTPASCHWSFRIQFYWHDGEKVRTEDETEEGQEKGPCNPFLLASKFVQLLKKLGDKIDPMAVKNWNFTSKMDEALEFFVKVLREGIKPGLW